MEREALMPKYTEEDMQRWKRETTLTELQIEKLYDRFNKLDRGGKGKIMKDDLTIIPSLAANPLVERIITVMTQEDTKCKDGVTFESFLHVMYVLSSATGKEEKLHFTFKVYDIDGDGKISNKDLYQALTIMVGSNLTGMQLQQIVDKTFIEADVNRDGYISYNEFRTLANTTDFGERLMFHF